MSSQDLRVREPAEIPSVERIGSRCRRHLGSVATQGKPDLSLERGFGPLRVFDDTVIDAGSRTHLEACDGLEVVVYVVEGECLVEDNRGHATDIGPGSAASALLGHGVQHDVRNRSQNAALHVLVAAVTAELANPRPRFIGGSFTTDTGHIAWFGSQEAEADEHVEVPPRLGSSVRMGVATLEPGVEHVFAKAVNRGLYVAVLQGQIEFGSSSFGSSDFVNGGGDAMASLESPVRIQGVSRSRAIVFDVPMGFSV